MYELKSSHFIKTQPQPHTPSIAFRHLPPKEGCRKPVLGVWRKDVVNQCLEFATTQQQQNKKYGQLSLKAQGQQQQ